MKAEHLLNALGEVDEMMVQDAKKHRTIKKRTKLYVGLIAAVLAAGALGLSAVVAYKNAEYTGEYPLLFQMFFSKKSETEVEYDFTDFGEELGDTIEFDGGRILTRSIIADDMRAYLIYDVELTDLSVIPENCTGAFNIVNAWYVNEEGECVASSGTGELLEQPYEGTYTFCWSIEFGGETISPDGCIEYEFQSIDFAYETGYEEVDSVSLPIGETYTMELDFMKDGTCVEKTMDIPLSEKSHTSVTNVKLSPFTLRVTFSQYVALDTQKSFYDRFTVVYEDGTEETLLLDYYCFGALPDPAEDGRKPALLDAALRKPVDYEKVVCIRFDDLELPLR